MPLDPAIKSQDDILESNDMPNSKSTALDHIYTLYADVIKSVNVACARGCSTCCTQHVTMTTLEGDKIFQYIRKNRPEIDLERIIRRADARRFQPRITTNKFAGLCLQGKDVPDEEGSCVHTICQFLSNNECTIYDARPFGCRCFISSITCTEETYAVVDPFMVTINSIFLQGIEQADVGGYFGNIYDMLSMCAANHRETHIPDIPSKEKEASLQEVCSQRTAQNHPIPAWMIPPEHREQARPVVEALKRILKQIQCE